MPTNITGRVVVILGVLYVALSGIVPQAPGSLFWFFNPTQISFKPNLKPGIDMVGGTSLTYEIRPPEGGGALSSGVTEQVMTSLKKRVDPNGVMNLIWRPQGNNQIEIQMPSSGKEGQTKERRTAFAAAQQRLEETNVRATEVIRAVERYKGKERDDRLAKLAMGSKTRTDLFANLAKTYDQMKAAEAAKNTTLQAEKELDYERLKSAIDDTNLSARDLEQTLAKGATVRDEQLKELRKKYANFQERLDAIDQFQKAQAGFAEVKGNLDDATDLKAMLRGSGVLEFFILVPIEPANMTPEVKAMVDRLRKSGPAVQAGDTMRWFPLDKPEELHGQSISYNDKQWGLCFISPDKSLTANRMPGWGLRRAYKQVDNGETKVAFEFDPQGAQYFADLTGANVGKQLAIVLDDKLISAPTLQSKIGQTGVITGGGGGFSQKEANYLISTLSAGSLPARLAEDPISERTIGPQLGADNLRRGLMACAIGLVVVAVFLISYYYLAGVVAFFAVCLNVVLILGTMAAFNATFTLPGIAGIVLTIGAAVDANVLIFERLREEQQRGLSLRMAMRNAYDRAWSAIVDSNATTVFTSLFLYWFGSEEVKGFGLTLLIGLIWSMFTALFVTKTIFAILIDHFHVTNLRSLPLTFPKWDRALKPNWDWIGKIWWFLGVSAIIIVVGCSAFIIKAEKREVADIEFASGTSVMFTLKESMPIDDVRHMVDKPQFAAALPSPSVVSSGTNEKTKSGKDGYREYEIVTPNPKATEVRETVIKAIGTSLQVELPSNFTGRGTPVAEALGTQVIPLKTDAKEDFALDGWTPPEVGKYTGGAAIVLRDLNPPLSPTDIKARIERQRLQPQASGIASSSGYRDYTVVAESGPTKPTTTAVVLVSDPNLPFDRDELKWREEVAGPMWRLVNDAVYREAQLQRVSNFNPQVAGAARDDAILALTLSLLVIMAYIWLRFGNLKYGAATVVAMLHDTILVIGAIGLSHYLANTWIGDLLLIEPFRINLTIVAAILTVMSYSMIDTIVVFDRVRENRGKLGHANKNVINDSINQTLSRTLLTGGTNILTVLVMYVMGGPGIHGFTFVLLVGILVGTYSSIAIAAPILLIGEEKVKEEASRPVAQLQRA